MRGPLGTSGGSGEHRRAWRRRAVVGALAAAAILAVPAAATASPSVATDGVEATGATTAVVDGNANPEGPDTKLWADYAVSGSKWCVSHGAEGTPAQTSPLDIGIGEVEYSELTVTLEGLMPAHRYCTALVASNELGTKSGGQVRFSTDTVTATAPSAVAESASQVEREFARINATIEPDGSETTYEVWIADPCAPPVECIRDVRVGRGRIASPVRRKRISVEVGAGSEGSPNIEPETTYVYWVTVRNTHGTGEGAHQTFTTPPPGAPPRILREWATGATSTAAVLHAEINPGGLPTEYEFWLEDPCPGLAECIRDVIVGHGSIPPLLTSRSVRLELSKAEGDPNIEPGTRYQYWVTASNGAGATESARATFKTSG